MLIQGAQLEGGGIADVRIGHGRIAAIGALTPHEREPVVAAHAGLLLPGLHDHHLHLLALAAATASVRCGPPDVTDAPGLAAALGARGTGWLRGIGYHESVAGLLDAAMLDRMAPGRPVRVQHRGGRMWFLNSAALDLLLAAHDPPPGLERIDGRHTGRLFEGDTWLRAALAATPPGLGAVGAMLARRGVTGVTDMTPANDAGIARHMATQHAGAALPQKLLLAGTPGLRAADMAPGVRLGPVKLHLHEADLPAFDATVTLMRAAHDDARAVAVHCVTEVELVFTLAALRAAGVRPGDRIEHAGIATDDAVADIADLGLAVVSQPHFVAERGDAYRADVAVADQPLLYRLRSFLDSGVTLAAGSDAPFGGVDPWASMAAAIARTTPSGATVGAGEALTPERALDLWLGEPDALDRRRRVQVGAPADLCLLDRDWAHARRDLASVGVRATWVDGRLIHDCIDQPPA